MKALINELIKNSKNLSKNSKRLFHGRGHSFSGFEKISIDWFDPIVLVDCFGEVENLEKILLVIDQTLNNKAEVILYRNRKIRPIECRAFRGIIPDKHHAVWHDLKFEIDFKTNQNIGFFLDSENLRTLVAKLSPNKKVLNLFSYTCSLSVIAKFNNAKNITNIDMSKSALKIGQKNHIRSNLETDYISFLSYNIMKSLRGIEKKGKWDLIIIDPPSSQGKSFDIKRDYQNLIKSISNWSCKQCDLILCLNSPFIKSSFLIELCKNYIPNFTLQKIYYSPNEFVEIDKEKGVKILHLSNASISS